MRTGYFVRRIMLFAASALATVMLAVTVVTAQTPADLLLIVLNQDKSGSVLGFVDVAAGKIVDRVPIGHDPHIVRMSTDGKLAFVNNRNSFAKRIPERDSISIIDVATRKEIRRAEVGDGSRPHDLQVVGDKVYFSAAGFKAVGRYDVTRNKVEYFGVGQGGPTQIVVSRNGDTVIGVNPGTNNVSLIQNVLAGWVEKLPPNRIGPVTSFTHWTHTLIPVGNGPSGIAISPDGSQVWTANEDEGGGVSIVNLAKKTAETVDLQTRHVVRLRFTPDGKSVLLLDREPGELTVVDVATRKATKRVRFTGETPGLVMTTGNLAVDGAYAYATVSTEKGGSERDHYIAVIDLRTMEVTKRIQTNSYANGVTCARCS